MKEMSLREFLARQERRRLLLEKAGLLGDALLQKAGMAPLYEEHRRKRASDGNPEGGDGAAGSVEDESAGR